MATSERLWRQAAPRSGPPPPLPLPPPCFWSTKPCESARQHAVRCKDRIEELAYRVNGLAAGALFDPSVQRRGQHA